jgi:hypothetical protein
MICYDSISHKSTHTWKTGLELHEDDETIFSSHSSQVNLRYQVLAFIGDNSEEFGDNDNPVLNPANVTRGANHLAEGDTADSLTTRVKIRLSADEWKTIKAAIDNGTAIPVDASKEVLQRYHYALHRQARQLVMRVNLFLSPFVVTCTNSFKIFSLLLSFYRVRDQRSQWE